jgi:hypothetical protein
MITEWNTRRSNNKSRRNSSSFDTKKGASIKKLYNSFSSLITEVPSAH